MQSRPHTARLLPRTLTAGASLALLVAGAMWTTPAGARPPSAHRGAAAVDWATYGYDAQRSGYNPNETVIGVSNAASLHTVWSVDLGAVMIAQPVEAAGVPVNDVPTDVVYIGTEHGDFYALKAADGTVVWQKNLGSVQTNCHDMPDGIFGIGGAGAIDGTANLVYVAGGDGNVHALDLATGAEASGWPVTGVFDKNQEHVYGGANIDAATRQMYVAVASHCDFAPYRGKLVDIDVPSHSITHVFYPAGTFNGGGIWGPGGASLDLANHHVFVATGNALTNPEYYLYSEDVVELDSALNVLGHNYPGLQGGDVDFGATPLLFKAPGCPTQVVAKNKSGVLVLYREGKLNNGYRQRLQVASVNGYQFNGIPAWSPVTNLLYIGNSSSSNLGTFKAGMVAMRVNAKCRLRLAWQKADAISTDHSVSPPTVANGVVYYGVGYERLEYAYDAATGKRLWNSGNTIGGALFAAPTVVNGQLLVPSWDHKLYAFAP
jgi:outer membrane protein assembly factor BamB